MAQKVGPQRTQFARAKYICKHIIRCKVGHLNEPSDNAARVID